MKKASGNWKCLRQAVLDRAQRKAIEPLEPLYAIHVAVCTYYLVGFLRFKFFDHSAAFTFIETIQLLSVAVAGVLVLILTGSVFTLHFASRKLQKLAND